jgi:hypothetical protein
MQNSTLDCPNCGETIDVNNLLYDQLQGEIKRDYQQKLVAQQKGFSEREEAIKVQQLELKNAKGAMQDQVEENVEKRVLELKRDLETRLKNKLEEENEGRIESMRKELSEKSEKVKELHRANATIEQLKRDKEEAKEFANLAAEKKVTEELGKLKLEIKRAEEDKHELIIKELQKQLDDQKLMTREMKRKQEQGSVQLQGEVQELAMEEFLKAEFPLDTIDEIKKGERGADCLQTVHTRSRPNCGTILYESKRAKAFSSGWIDKFKTDLQTKGADFGVLVTEAMPSDMDRMGNIDKIWVCTYSEFKGLSGVLREVVIRLSDAAVSQENKGDKMTLLYDYMTSNEFQMHAKGVIEGFTQIKADIQTERNAMERNWKRREKQLQKIMMSTSGMMGSVEGIAGAIVGPLQVLQMPDDTAED